MANKFKFTTMTETQIKFQEEMFNQMLAQHQINPEFFNELLKEKKYNSISELVYAWCCRVSPWDPGSISLLNWDAYKIFHDVFTFKTNTLEGYQGEIIKFLKKYPIFREADPKESARMMREVLNELNHLNPDAHWNTINEVPLYGGKILPKPLKEKTPEADPDKLELEAFLTRMMDEPPPEYIVPRLGPQEDPGELHEGGH
jgi:hypothetical protein